MRYTILFTFLLLFGFTHAQEGPINKGETWHRIYPDKSLELKVDEHYNFYAEVAGGKDLVFEYYMRADEYVERSDDEYTEKILFSVPKKATSFFYTDTTLKAAFLRGCFCPDRGWHLFSDGFIKGKKINSTTWHVEIDVMTKPDLSRNSNAVTKRFKANYMIYAAPVSKKKK